MSFFQCRPAKNFGVSGCVGTLDRAEKLAFVPMTDSQGNAAAILLADVLDDTYITGMINTGDKTNVSTTRDKSKMWFPTGVINAVSNKRADNNTFALDGFELNSSKGVKTLSFTVVDDADYSMADAFESYNTGNYGFWQWSVTSQIGGNGKVAGELRPFRIKKNTMRVVPNEENKVDESPIMITVSFDLAESEDDRDIAFINNGTETGQVLVDVLTYNGLFDMTMGAATSITTTGFTSEMILTYHSEVFVKKPFIGALPGDFTLFNENTVLAVTILTAPESPEGTYAFTYVAQTSADVLTLTHYKEGVEATDTLTITTP